MKTKSAKSTATAVATGSLLQIDPARIWPGTNVRFSLKSFRVNRLADDILEAGEVKQPITVSVLPEDHPERANGFDYLLIDGAYRTAASMKLNKEKNAGIVIPAILRPYTSDLERLRLQVSMNVERENMSTMDCAISIKRLLESGVARVEIMKIFARPTGKQGIKMQPASNAWLNMVVSFLDFPKKIQDRIHDGRIGVAGAYELHKHKPEEWDAIAERIEANRLKEIGKEELEEKKSLESDKKAEEARQKLEALEKAKVDAAAIVAGSEKAVAETAKAAKEAFDATLIAKGKDAKTAAEVAFKSAKAANETAKQTHAKNEAELAKTVKALAPKEKPVVATAPPADPGTTPTKPAGPAEVSKAAGQISEETGKDVSHHVKLNAAQMREAAKSLILLSGDKAKYPKTIAIGTLFEKCFNGEITDGQLQSAVAKIVGEEVVKAPTPAPARKK